MTTPEFDMVVVGGGIHGVGVAQAAVASGYSVLLLEQQSIAAETSSRSSKLIHGGLRYLETAQWGLVREALREREILLRIAPSLVRRVSFYIPVYATMSRPPWKIRLGLSLYSLLGGLARENRFETLPQSRWNQLDGLDTHGLKAVYRYMDAQTDDRLLTQAVMRSAQNLGAELCCPGIFLRATWDGASYEVGYQDSQKNSVCRTRTLVNAAGSNVNTVLASITPKPPTLPVEWVQGAHILVSEKTRNGIYYVEAPDDRRAVFVMPWHDHTLIGTTETPLSALPENTRARPEEITYLQQTWQHYFPRAQGKLLESFAGIRVLPASTTSVFQRRREVVLRSYPDQNPSLVTVYGGKLTTYRSTAVRVIGLLKRSLPSRSMQADTAQLALF